jgi:predicted  nucleic acid-binding Zn-ribbon protein
MLCGWGTLTYRCGGCGIELLAGVSERNLKEIVFHCPGCGAYSEVA